jgi:PAS domain S-box-containing protein
VLSELETGCLIDINDASFELFGYRREETVGHAATDIGLWPSSEDRRRFVEYLKRVGSIRNLEVGLRNKAGQVRRCLVSAELIELHGKPCMVTVGQDITEQKRAEDALYQREQDLRHAMEERERISQDLHDGILQSLYAVGLGLESCKPLMRQRKHKQATVLLEQAIEQMNHVMSEVRNFIAGLESQVLQGGDFPTALRTMVQVLTASQPIKCRLVIDKRASQHVSTEQALHLLNLVREALSNSLRHGRATRATVSFKLLTHSIRLLVTDNGRGFHPDRVQRIGHGLVNMAARAQKMGGRFAVQSKPKEGTRITVDVPKEDAYAHG